MENCFIGGIGGDKGDKGDKGDRGLKALKLPITPITPITPIILPLTGNKNVTREKGGNTPKAWVLKRHP